MRNPSALARLLLVSTALYSFPAFAQDQSAPASNASASDAVSTAEPAVDEAVDDTDVSVPGGGNFSEIVVRGRNIPNTIRATSQVISVLSNAELARSGDGDIAGALQRVTGMSVAGNGFVYVRGLGDRYSLALLNGLPLPSPEPLRRVVPLDIFPTSVLASTLVQKSYSVNYPGEFGGGVINLTTTAIPEESYLKIGGSVSGNTETTNKLGYTYYGSGSDWTGFDGGKRGTPPLLKQAFASGRDISSYSGDELRGMAYELLNSDTTVVQRNDKLPVNYSVDISGGAAKDVGDDGTLGVILNLGFSNNWTTRNATQQAETEGGRENYLAVRTENRAVLNAMLGVGYEWADHKVRWTNLYIHDTSKLARLRIGDRENGFGLDNSGAPELMQQQTAWYERQLINTQLAAELDFGDVDFDIRGGYANSKRDAPYEREIGYAYRDTVDPVTGEAKQAYVNNLTGQYENASIAFNKLNEDLWSIGYDVSYKLPTARDIIVSAGFSHTDTQRSAYRRALVFRSTSGALPSFIAQLRPDFLLSDQSIDYNNITLQESGERAGLAYDGALQVTGTYGKIEAEIIPSVKLEAGVRYEDARQQVTLVDLVGLGNIPQADPIEQDYLLPAATITWNFVDDMQLRFHASKTIARPQFRELAPQSYFDPETDRVFKGNPFLVDSKLFNAEARYEYYFARDQRFSLAGFYKKIDNPIEIVAAGDLTTFANAPVAKLYGAEVEAVKFVPLADVGNSDFWASRRLVLIANYTYSKSEIKVGDGDTVIIDQGFVPVTRGAGTIFRNGSPLTGQSKHLANFQIGIEDEDRLSQYTVLVSYASKRVTARGQVEGANFAADFYERPGVRLDFVGRQGVKLAGQEVELKFEARNLLNTDYRETQQRQTYTLIRNQYEQGISFSLGASVKF